MRMVGVFRLVLVLSKYALKPQAHSAKRSANGLLQSDQTEKLEPQPQPEAALGLVT